jgi:hypothetical protein
VGLPPTHPSRANVPGRPSWRGVEKSGAEMKPEIDQDHIDELRAIPCKRGHSRHDAYISFKDGTVNLSCKTCARLRYVTVRNLEVRVDRLEKLIKRIEGLETRTRMMAGR